MLINIHFIEGKSLTKNCIVWNKISRLTSIFVY